MDRLNHITHNLITVFLKNKNVKIRKVFRICLRIVYIIYDKNVTNTSKIIKFFKTNFLFLVDTFNEIEASNEYKELILKDFVEVNFNILQKKSDLLEYYTFFYKLLINRDEGNMPLVKNSSLQKILCKTYLECIENLFKYEMTIISDLNGKQFIECSYMKLIHNLFNIIYYELNDQSNQKHISIEILCRILRNCEDEKKIYILDEITITHISFFTQDANCRLLENLLKSIETKINIKGIYEYYIKYLDILFLHCKRGNLEFEEFINYINFICTVHKDKLQIFEATVHYSKKFLEYLQEENVLHLVVDHKTSTMNLKRIKEINGFLKTVALSSIDVPIDQNLSSGLLHDLLNIYSFFLLIKVNYYKIPFTYLFTYLLIS